MGLPVLPSPRLPRDVLVELVRTLSGVEVNWRTKRRQNPGKAPSKEVAWIDLWAQSYAAVGNDELRAVFDEVNNVRQTVLVGQRTFTLSMVARSLDGTLEAFDLLERVRFRMSTQTARNIFVPANLSIRNYEAIHTLPDAESDGHAILQATWDMSWNFVVFADPNDPGESAFIETIGVAPVGSGSELLP